MNRSVDGITWKPRHIPYFVLPDMTEPVIAPSVSPKKKVRHSGWFTFSLIVVGLFFTVRPFAEDLTLYYSKATDPTQGYRYESRLATEKVEAHEISPNTLQAAPQDNRLVIPKIGVDSHVYEGTNEAVLDKGVWHRPNSSTPDKGGNTVLTAHRFMYTSGKNTFYHLDMLAVGDQFTVFWKGENYAYTVKETKVVPADNLSIEDSTTEAQVTLYSCTPLFSTTDRLVVIATLTN